MKRVPSTPEARATQLAACPLFSELSGAQHAALARIAAGRRYERDEIVFFQGDPADGFCVLAEGRVKIYRTGADGREQILHLFGPGEVCGEAPVFEGNRYPATMMALEPTTLLYIDRREFLALGTEEPQILLRMLAVLSKRLRHFVNLVDDLALKEVSARLARYLLVRAGESHSEADIELDVSKSVLAAHLGTIPETLSRTLRKMQDQKCLRVQGKRIRILDPVMIRALAEGEKL